MGIDFTFDPERHLYRVAGPPVPSVTQGAPLDSPCGRLLDGSAGALERKRIIGEYVHKAAQYLEDRIEASSPETQ